MSKAADRRSRLPHEAAEPKHARPKAPAEKPKPRITDSTPSITRLFRERERAERPRTDPIYVRTVSGVDIARIHAVETVTEGFAPGGGGTRITIVVADDSEWCSKPPPKTPGLSWDHPDSDPVGDLVAARELMERRGMLDPSRPVYASGGPLDGGVFRVADPGSSIASDVTITTGTATSGTTTWPTGAVHVDISTEEITMPIQSDREWRDADVLKARIEAMRTAAYLHRVAGVAQGIPATGPVTTSPTYPSPVMTPVNDQQVVNTAQRLLHFLLSGA